MCKLIIYLLNYYMNNFLVICDLNVVWGLGVSKKLFFFLLFVLLIFNCSSRKVWVYFFLRLIIFDFNVNWN